MNQKSDLEKQSWNAGFDAGANPDTPYGIKAPEGLATLVFTAGLIEGRALARTRKIKRQELVPLI